MMNALERLKKGNYANNNNFVSLSKRSGSEENKELQLYKHGNGTDIQQYMVT